MATTVPGDRGKRCLPTRGRRIADDELIVGNSGQRTQLTTCSLEGAGLLPGEYLRRDPAAGLDSSFGSGIADRADNVDQRPEVIFSGFVSRSSTRPGGDHHALALVWQLLPEASVTNGMNGWRSRMERSIVCASVCATA
jgi:hypothetical protein